MSISHDEPRAMSIDEVRTEIDIAVTRMQGGDIAASVALVPLWAALNDHLCQGGELPRLWVEVASVAADNITEDGFGQSGFQFDTPPPSVPFITVITGPRAVTIPRPTNFVPVIPATTPPSRVAPTLGAPSTLNHIGWEHNIDAPDTSVSVHRKMALKAGKANHEVFFTILDAGINGYTDDELELRLERAHQSVSATRRGLVRMGYLEESGRKRETRYGNPAIVWVVTPMATTRVLNGDEKRFTP